jgi:hypothetical protein
MEQMLQRHFAVVTATIIRTFVFEGLIPFQHLQWKNITGKMTFLFVSRIFLRSRSKTHQITVLVCAPHRTFCSCKIIYKKRNSIPYIRWLASPVKGTTWLSFNFPLNITLINDKDQQFGSQGNLLPSKRYWQGRDTWNRYGSDIITRPVDKENFIKRCVAVGVIYYRL